MEVDYEDIIAQQCESSRTQSYDKPDSTQPQTGDSNSKRSLALTHAEVSFYLNIDRLHCRFSFSHCGSQRARTVRVRFSFRVNSINQSIIYLPTV